jgi:hypothetical protein
MKRLIRNTTEDGRCKYALVRLDKITTENLNKIEAALSTLYHAGVLEYGEKGSEEEFFAIKLKDVNAPFSLRAYAVSCLVTLPNEEQFAKDIFELADRAEKHPIRKIPT